jgi:hypothetical protein
MIRAIAFLVALALLTVRLADGMAHQQLDAQPVKITAAVVVLHDTEAKQESSLDIFHAAAHCASQMADHLLRVQPIWLADLALSSETLPLPAFLARQSRDLSPPVRPPLA